MCVCLCMCVFVHKYNAVCIHMINVRMHVCEHVCAYVYSVYVYNIEIC